MTKRILALMLSLIMAATLFVACGNESKADMEDKKDTTSAPTAVATDNATATPTEVTTEPATFVFPEDADVLAGSWTVSKDSMVMNFFFNGSGRGTFTSFDRHMKMAYKIEGNEVIIVIYYEEANDYSTQVFTFEINDDKLTLTTEDGLDQVFTKDSI